MRRSFRPEGVALEPLAPQELEVLRVISRRVVRRLDEQGLDYKEHGSALERWREIGASVEAEQKYRARRALSA